MSGDRGGFTLIEVLIAMIVLAVGLLALEGLGIVAARSVAQADRRTEYVSLTTDSLESALAQLRAPAPSVPTAFCIDTFSRGERMERTVDLNNSSAPLVTVRMFPGPAGFGMPRDTLTVRSTVFVQTALSGGGGSGC